jgi:uncharacterized protein YndB with AHSA1/START domain
MSERHRVGSREFSCFANAGPDVVWSALTDPAQTGRYLYGLAARSSWQPDAPIQFETPDGDTLIGRVLHVDEPHRLSYLLQSSVNDPSTYLTWHVRPCHAGSAVRLQVDETVAIADDNEAENTWLPVLAALQELLNAKPPAELSDNEPN